MFARQASTVKLMFVDTVETLTGDDNVFRLNFQVAHHPAKNFFRCTVRIHIGCVIEVDARLPCVSQNGKRGVN